MSQSVKSQRGCIKKHFKKPRFEPFPSFNFNYELSHHIPTKSCLTCLEGFFPYCSRQITMKLKLSKALWFVVIAFRIAAARGASAYFLRLIYLTSRRPWSGFHEAQLWGWKASPYCGWGDVLQRSHPPDPLKDDKFPMFLLDSGPHTRLLLGFQIISHWQGLPQFFFLEQYEEVRSRVISRCRWARASQGRPRSWWTGPVACS